MTSTNVYLGNFGDKPSSRVLKPPGGGNSNIFGAPDEPKKPANVPKKVDNVFHQQEEPVKNVEKCEADKKVEEVGESSTSVKTDAPKEAPAQLKADSFKNRHQGSFNPITGQAYHNENVPSQASQTRSSTAVRQPPGGASSKLW